jgi:hypothetical protein
MDSALNRAFKQWPEILNDSTLTSALLDRLLHHAETHVIVGKSYRMKDSRPLHHLTKLSGYNYFPTTKTSKESLTIAGRCFVPGCTYIPA